jgi:ribokinase
MAKVVVVGSAVLDLTWRVPALPSPGQSALAAAYEEGLGGKGANQAVAAARLGVPTLFVGAVGRDEAGDRHEADLRDQGLDLHLVRADAPTGRAAVVVDEQGDNQIAVHPGANLSLAPKDLDAVGDWLRRAAVVVTQLEVSPDVVRRAAQLAREGGGIALLNAAPFREGAGELARSFDVVVANLVEAEALAEVAIRSVEDAFAAVRAMKGEGIADPVITLGAGGAVYLDDGRPVHAPAPEVEAVDTTGAGDAFVGALAAFLAEGQGLDDAVPAACRYAALSVTKPGTRASYADRAAFDALAAEA